MTATVDLMKTLSTNAATMRFNPGQVITKEGEVGDTMFLVL